MTEDERLCGGNFRLLFEGDDPFRRWLDGFYGPQHGFCYGILAYLCAAMSTTRWAEFARLH